MNRFNFKEAWVIKHSIETMIVLDLSDVYGRIIMASDVIDYLDNKEYIISMLPISDSSWKSSLFKRRLVDETIL